MAHKLLTTAEPIAPSGQRSVATGVPHPDGQPVHRLVSTASTGPRVASASEAPIRRVVFFTETFLPRVDGIVNTLCWTLRGLIEAGCEPLVVAPAGNDTEFPGARVVAANAATFPLYPEVRLAVAGPGIWRTLDEFNPDLVHLVGPVVNGVGGLLYAQARGVPVVASYHTDLPRYAHHYALGWLEGGIWGALRAVHNRCALTLCPSTAVMDDLRQHGFERLRYWSRGVDTRLFSLHRRSPAWRARLGTADADILLLYVGRLAREKRIDDLLPLARLPGVHLAIVGDGPARAELEATFAGTGATFTGRLQGTDLASAYAAADVFVFPSDSEAFGNVVLEAMACGLPVVAAAAGGVLDLVQPGSTGALFPAGDRDALTGLVARYRDAAPLRHEHGLAGLAAARERTWQRQHALLLDQYRAALRMHGPAAA